MDGDGETYFLSHDHTYFSCNERKELQKKYVICSSELFTRITDVDVDELDKFLSDNHHPISVSIQIIIKPARTTYTVSKDCFENNLSDMRETCNKRIRWSDDKIQDFVNSFSDDDISCLHDKLIELKDVPHDIVESVVGDLICI